MNGRIFLPHLDRGFKPQHVVHGAFYQTHSAGDGGTDDVLSLRGKAAVSLDEFAAGVTRFCFGLAKKMVIANAMGQIADGVFNQTAANLDPGLS